MVLVYRNEKNAPLTVEELDGNFQDLDKRLHYLEEQLAKNVVPQTIKIDKNKIFFLGYQGHILAEIPLPSLQLNPRGTWAPQNLYQKFDVIAAPGQSFLCTQDHCSGNSLEQDISQKKWQLFIDVYPLLKGK